MIPSHDQRHFFLEIQWQEVLGAKCSEHRPGGHGQLLSCLLLSGAKLSAPHVTLKSPYLWTQATSAPPGFPGSPAGKESTCHAGDPGSIPGSGSSPGEGIGYRLQYSWASLVTQMVKNPPPMWEILGSVPGLGRSPGEGHGYPLHYSCLENPHEQRSLEGYSPQGRKESDKIEHSTVLLRMARLCKPPFLNWLGNYYFFLLVSIISTIKSMLLFFPPKENIKTAKMIVFNCHKTFALGPACRPSCFEFLSPSKPASIPHVIENLKPLLSKCLHTIPPKLEQCLE